MEDMEHKVVETQCTNLASVSVLCLGEGFSSFWEIDINNSAIPVFSLYFTCNKSNLISLKIANER